MGVLRVCAFALVATFVLAGQVAAQAVTTAVLTGRVSDPARGPIAGAQVSITNLATGVATGVQTRDDGRYQAAGLRPGVYRVAVEYIGFRGEVAESVQLLLGVTERLDFVLQQQAVELSGIEVTGERSGVISRGRTGTGTVLAQEAVATTPTVTRNFADLTRLTPQVTSVRVADGVEATSGAGRNNRYNNIQIDGAVNNDLFGLAASGTPGGQADARPITLEAIQEFQVLIAPFDVRQGGFTGANINAVTKGGTNDFTGSAAYYGRNQNFIGRYKQFNDSLAPEIDDFSQFDLALSLGGPIARDRAHFFVAGEISRREEPFGAILGQNTGPTIAEVQQIEQIARSQYGYDPGRNDQFPRETDSNNIFARLDFALSPEHRLTLRHNYVDATADRTTGGPGSTFGWSNSGYAFGSTTNSSVAQLNSTLRAGSVFNEFRVGLTFVRDTREIGDPFPRVRVNLGSNNVRIGPDEFSGQNALDQDIIEITNDLTFSRGAHNITLGTSNEFFQFSNLFVRNSFGNYTFASIEDFETGNANDYEYSFLLPGGDVRAEFPVRRYSVYAQDQWAATDDLTLTFGLRVDMTHFPDEPKENAVVAAANLGRRTSDMPGLTAQFNPRIGFNWDALGDRSTQVRGGVGLFSGRTPFVWISNAYGNTGLDYARFRCQNDEAPLFNPDPASQARQCATSTTLIPNEINTVDPDYKFPQLFRASAAVDREIGSGFIASVEGLYSKTLNDILYRNLLVQQAADATMVEGRRRYVRTAVSGIGDVIDLSNSSEGYGWDITFQVQRPIRDRWGVNLAYTRADAWDKNVGGSSQAVSNWRFNPTAGDPNDPKLARGSYVNRHKVLATGSYQLNLIRQAPTTVSLVYVGSSGQAYSYVYSGDVNGDGQTGNDLAYIPSSPSDVRFYDGGTITPEQSWNNLNSFIESQDCVRDARGSIIERGACTEPWINQFDLRVVQQLHTFGRQRAEITLDILNVANLLNKDWGRREFIANETVNLLSVRSNTPDANGRVLMNQFAPTERSTSISNLMSRYQLQLGARYAF